jgi:Smg protein
LGRLDVRQGLAADLLRYIEAMFEVLVYVYENFWQGDACPEAPQLGRKLSAAGFESDEIEAALIWLDGLQLAAQTSRLCPSDGQTSAACAWPQSADSLRIYSMSERQHLGPDALGFLSFLESAGVLPPHMREIVVDRAMAAAGEPMALDDLKIIVLMVYWSLGQEPDALVLDELCDDNSARLAH